MALRQSLLRLGRLGRHQGLTSRIDVRCVSTEARKVATMLHGLDSTAAQEAWKRRQERALALKQMGAAKDPIYRPSELIANPPSPADISLELLLASQSHMGHSTSLWNPRNSKYIYGVREGIHIISLETTAAYLKRACRVVEGVALRGGLILFVGTRKGQRLCVIKAAELAKGCHLFERWIPGSLTNAQLILGNCKTIVVDELDREMPKYASQLKDTAALRPDLVVCLNPLENEVLLHECSIYNIPTIGIIDTDANPTWVTYPIPANDDSVRCVEVIAGVLGRAGELGHQKRLELAKEGKVLYDRVELKEPGKSGAQESGFQEPDLATQVRPGWEGGEEDDDDYDLEEFDEDEEFDEEDEFDEDEEFDDEDDDFEDEGDEFDEEEREEEEIPGRRKRIEGS